MLLEIDHRLEKSIIELANAEHKTVEQLVNDALTELLEDYHDVQAADDVLKRIENGTERVYSLAEVETELNALED